MGFEVAADSQLDYVKFRILPQNRYEAFICCKEKEELMGDGSLDQLLQHLPSVKDQIALGSCDNFKLELPDSVDNGSCFTKDTLTRFLQIVNSPELLTKTVAIFDEMYQLEETRKFHLSLYSQAEGIKSSDNSKNELLLAMDSRLTAVTEEFVSTFNLAAGTILSLKEMMDLQNFCHHFASVDISKLLSKCLEIKQKGHSGDQLDRQKKSPIPTISKDDYEKKTGRNNQLIESSHAVKPVKYNASPAKAAEVERQSSSESEDSSFSSEDDQPSVERSRTLVRSASPRRSASPMRRIQIGRSGSRRTPALSVKSLTFPARERNPTFRDTEYDRSEDSEERNKKTEVNVVRISVQDAISLFEGKKTDQTVDGQKKASPNDNATTTNKTVLRRWSSGVGESQKSQNQDTVPQISGNTDATLDGEQSFENRDSERKVDMEPEKSENSTSDAISNDVPADQVGESNEQFDSAEWNRQKEEELNQMLMKFAQFGQISDKNIEPDNGKNLPSPVQRSGVMSSKSKDKKAEKLRAENATKRVEKLAEGRTKQNVTKKPKAEKTSSKVSDAGKKQITTRTLNAKKENLLSSNAKKESPKDVVSKKTPPKSSPLPATRKSWPSAPSPRATGTLPTKIPTGRTPPSELIAPRRKSQSPAPRQKPQSPAPSSRSIPKVDRPQLQQKEPKKSEVDVKKSVKKADDIKNRSVTKSGRTTKTKSAVAPENEAVTPPTNAAIRKKVTKRSSVVPLESKPSTRKVSGLKPTNSPALQKIEIITPVEETSSKCDHPAIVEENGGGSTPLLDTVNTQADSVSGIDPDNPQLEKEKPKSEYENDISDETPVQSGDIAERLSESPAAMQPSEEPDISPAAWEESNQEKPSVMDCITSSSAANHETEVSSGSRIRHSLSQMLLEETSEPEIIEWGNAENPPTMVYQKDAPKGLKRLLKFARKSKGEANGAAWSSPYTSEAEDDGDEYKSLGKRHSDNLLKIALHSKNYGEGFLSDSEPASARSNVSNSSARSANKYQDGYSSSKGSRSFFSLSAFRGNKS